MNKHESTNWKEIQDKHNAGASQLDLCKEYRQVVIQYGIKHSFLKFRSHAAGVKNTLQTKGARKQSEETKAKMRLTCGGYRPGSGRGKSGWYGVWCDSTWELAWVVYNMDHGIYFERNTQSFDYVFDNKVWKYFPDFILADGTFVEIKGIEDDRHKAKISQFPHYIQVVNAQGILPYLVYATEKHGKDLTVLFGAVKKKTKTEIEREARKEIVTSSNIDFKHRGWPNELATVLNITPQKTAKWIKTHMPELL